MFSEKYEAIDSMLNRDATRIVTLKLISGEEIVADAKLSAHIKDSLVIYRPLKIVEVTRDTVKFQRWVVSSLRQVYPLDYSDIMMITRPSNRVINAYFQRTKVDYDNRHESKQEDAESHDELETTGQP